MKKLLVLWVLIPVICNSQQLKNIPFLGIYTDSIAYSPTVREIDGKLVELISNPDTLLNHDKKVAQRWYTYEFSKYNVLDSNIYDLEPYLQATKAIYTSPLNCGAQDPANWVSDGPVMPHINGTGKQWGGWVNAIYQKPSNPNIMLVGTRTSGIFRTINEGESWVCVTDGLNFPVLGVKQMICDPNNENHILGITGTEYIDGGVIYSSDAGATWNKITQTLPSFNWIGFNKLVPGLVFAVSSRKVYFSSNSGLTWEELDSYPELPDFYGFYKIVVLGDKLFVNTTKAYGVESHIYRCDFTYENNELDVTWSTNIAPIFAQEASSQTIPEHLVSFTDFSNVVNGKLYFQVQYKLTDNTPSQYINSVFKSTDDGDNFNYLSSVNIGNGGFYKNELVASIHDPNTFYWGSVFAMRRYNDITGVSIPINGLGHHDDYRSSHIVSQGNTDRIIFGNDGGVGLVEDGLNNPTIISKNSNLSINLLHALDVHEKTGRVLYAFQDHAMRYKNGDNSYYNGKFLHEGASALIQQYHPNDMVGENAYYGIKDVPGSSNPIVDLSGQSYFAFQRTYLGGSFISYRHFPERFARGLQGKEGINNGAVAMNRAALVSEVSEISESNAISPVAICERYPHHIFAGEREPGNQPTKLFKSVDDGLNWISMTNSMVSLDNGTTTDTLSKLLHWNVIRAISVHHTDTNIVYCGIGGTHTVNGIVTDERFRVIKSTDGGTNFIDYSEGLPALPVEKLLTIESDNDLIFCATSVGVYYRTNEMSQWECFSKNLPKVMITGMKYNYCEEELYVSTYGRGVWKTKVNLRKSSYAQEITATTVWNDSKHLIDNLLIKSGNTLTITDTVEISGGIKIMIEPGARLVVDGGVLTKYCNSRWQGIHVYGQSDLRQSYEHQGALITRNNAVIEFANQAVELWNKDSWNETGGIIIAENTTFRNNGKSVVFFPYQNIQPSGNEVRNISRLRGCSFIVDDTYVGNPPFDQVTMFRVNGVTIQKCHFEDQRTSVLLENRLRGIRTLDASFRVLGECPVGQPCDIHNFDEQYVTPTTFKNLSVGIHAQNAQTLSNAMIDRCHFDNVTTGVVVDAADNALVTRNLFETGNAGGVDITTEVATAYKIEGNTFRRTDVNTFNFGTQLFHSGPEFNEVFRNQYENTLVANWAIGVNRELNSPDASLNKGLQFLCNTYTNNYVDQHAAAQSIEISGEGIQDWQGSIDFSAGNTFDHTGYKSIVNTGENQSQFRYFYDPFNSDELPINSTEIISVPSNSNLCESSFQTIVISPSSPLLAVSRAQLWDTLGGVSGKLLSGQRILDSLQRLGDTSILYTEIANVTKNNSGAVFNQLQSYAPYLSEDLLYLLADVNPVDFPHEYLRDICILHPEISHKSEFIKHLTHKAVPMPQIMVDSILNSPEFSELTERRVQIRQLQGVKENYSTLLLQDNLSDSLYPSFDTIQDVIKYRGHLIEPLEILQGAIWSGNRSASLLALSNAKSWLENAGLHPVYEIIASDFIDLQQELLNRTNGTYLEGLSDSTAQVLRDYAETALGYAKFQAENYLCYFLDECSISYQTYSSPKSMSTDPQGNDESTQGNEIVSENGTISLYPNPASDEITLRLDKRVENLTYVVYNTQGQVLKSGKLHDVEQHTIPVGDLRAGNYMIRLRMDGQANQTLRFVVQ